MKFYYTDPLAAAWMAKHFGMKIAPDPREFPNAGDASFDENGVLMQASLAAMGAPKWRKWYVHPDSLSILEPQMGDLMTSEHRDGRIASFSKDGSFEDVDDYTWHKDIPVKIIQRNGFAFMWPESEE